MRYVWLSIINGVFTVTLICVLTGMFNLGMLKLKEDSKKKRFYKAYGKHVLLIEYALVLTLTFILLILMFLPSPFTGLAFGIWLIALFVAVVIHIHFFHVIVKSELYPYEILRTEKIRLYFALSTYSSFFLLFTLYLVFSSWKEIPREISVMVMDILVYPFIILFPMLFLSFMYLVGSIPNGRRARLSLKTVLDAMGTIREEKKTKQKMKLIKKRVKWFRKGLHSYNSYLYNSYPVHIEIIDIEQYHRSICGIALMGKRAEIEDAIKQIRFALNSIGGKKKGEGLRHFLIALKNIKSGKRKKKYPLAELNDMTRTLSFSDMVKERLKSPYVTVAIGIVAIVLQVLYFIWK